MIPPIAPAAGATLVPFGVVWFCYFACIGLFNPYAPLWFKELGFSTLAIGTIASLQSWTRVVMPYAWGWMGDHSGQRVRLLRWAAFGALLSVLMLLGVQGYGLVALATVLAFAFNGAVIPLSEATLAQHLHTARGIDAARYGRVRVWGSIGFIVAVTVGGALLEWVGIGAFPWLAVAMFALLWAAALNMPGGRDDLSGHAPAPPVLDVLRRPAVVWFFASVFFTVLAHTSLYAFFSLYLDSLGYAKSTVGVLWAVAVAVEVLFFWFQGRIAERATPERWLQWAGAVSVLRFAAIAAFGAQFSVLLVAQLLHVVTFAAHHAACIMLIGRHFPGALRGRGQALYTTLGYGIPGVLGGVGGGWLGARYGFAPVFWAAAAAGAVGWACAGVAARRAR